MSEYNYTETTAERPTRVMDTIRSKWDAFSRQLFASSTSYPKIHMDTCMIASSATNQMRICDVDLCLTEFGTFSNIFTLSEIRKNGQNPEVVCLFLKTINAFLEGLPDIPTEVRAQTDWITMLEQKVIVFYGYTYHQMLPIEDVYTNIWFMNTCAIRRIDHR